MKEQRENGNQGYNSGLAAGKDLFSVVLTWRARVSGQSGQNWGQGGKDEEGKRREEKKEKEREREKWIPVQLPSSQR